MAIKLLQRTPESLMHMPRREEKKFQKEQNKGQIKKHHQSDSKCGITTILHPKIPIIIVQISL